MSKEYQSQPDEIRRAAWEKGHLTPWQLLRICSWKSANGNLASLSLNAEDLIVERTATAIKVLRPFQDADAVNGPVDWDSWEDAVRIAIGSENKQSGLLGLAGVAYPSATAVLCILNPMAFPVMDRWTVHAIFDGVTRPQQAYFGAGYRAFAERLSELSREHYSGVSVHETDQVIMNAARNGEALPFAGDSLPKRT